MPLKILSEETNLSEPTTVDTASHVRLLNTGSTVKITQKNSEGDTIASMTLLANQSVTVIKDYTDTLEGGANVLATKLAFYY